MKTSKPKQKLGPNQRRWVKALRSGRYKQSDGYLRYKDSHCCLGVACRVFRVPSFKEGNLWNFGEVPEHGVAPKELIEKLALRSADGAIDGLSLNATNKLTQANDDGVSFADIATFIEKHPEAVFKEAK